MTTIVEPNHCPDQACLYIAVDLEDQLAHLSVVHPGEWVEVPVLGDPRGTRWVPGQAAVASGDRAPRNYAEQRALLEDSLRDIPPGGR